MHTNIVRSWISQWFLAKKNGNNFTRINHCMFIHLKPYLSYLTCIVCWEYFSIIFNVKKCTLYSIKYGVFCDWQRISVEKVCTHFLSARLKMITAKEWSSLQKGAQPIKQYWLLKLHKKIYLLYFFEYRAHFLNWKWCWNIPCTLYMEGSWERV